MGFDVTAALTAARNVLGILKDQTATTLDNELYDLLAAIDDSPALKSWLASKIGQQQNGVLSIESDPPEALVLEVRERRIDWSKLVAMLPTIIQLLGAFAK